MMMGNGPLSICGRQDRMHLEHILPDLLRRRGTFWERIQVQLFDISLSKVIPSNLFIIHSCIKPIKAWPLALGFRVKQNIIGV